MNHTRTNRSGSSSSYFPGKQFSSSVQQLQFSLWFKIGDPPGQRWSGWVNQLYNPKMWKTSFQSFSILLTTSVCKCISLDNSKVLPIGHRAYMFITYISNVELNTCMFHNTYKQNTYMSNFPIGIVTSMYILRTPPKKI